MLARSVSAASVSTAPCSRCATGTIGFPLMPDSPHRAFVVLDQDQAKRRIATRRNAAYGSRMAAKLGHVVYVHDAPSYFDQSTRGQIMKDAGKMLLRQIELRCDHAFLRWECERRFPGLHELGQFAQQVTDRPLRTRA